MTVAATCYLSYLYRSDPVRAPLCRWHQITLFIHSDINICVSIVLESVLRLVSQLLHMSEQIPALSFANLFMTLCIALAGSGKTAAIAIQPTRQ
jgi:hypothetical protein